MAVPGSDKFDFCLFVGFFVFSFLEKTNPWGTEHRLSFHDCAKELFAEFDKDDCLFCFCLCETFNSSIFFTILAKDVFVEFVVALLLLFW